MVVTLLLSINYHKDDAYVKETLPVMEFIKRLIRHILEKPYKMIAMTAFMPVTGKLTKNST